MSSEGRPEVLKIANKQFSTIRLRPGYDEEEVDAFLNAVELRLAASTRPEEHDEPGWT